MKRLTFITILLLLLIQVLNAQQLDKKTIDKKLDLKNDAVYILNGIPFDQKDSVKFDSILNTYPLEHLVELTKLRSDNGMIRCANNNVAIVYFATQQTKKEISKILKELKLKFPDKYWGFSQDILSDSKNPVLIVDNKVVHHTEAKEKIENLNKNEIYFIEYKAEPQDSEYYGQNAKNGLVRIWIKKGQPPTKVITNGGF